MHRAWHTAEEKNGPRHMTVEVGSEWREGTPVEGKGCGVLKEGNGSFYGEEAVTGACRTVRLAATCKLFWPLGLSQEGGGEADKLIAGLLPLGHDFLFAFLQVHPASPPGGRSLARQAAKGGCAGQPRK